MDSEDGCTWVADATDFSQLRPINTAKFLGIFEFKNFVERVEIHFCAALFCTEPHEIITCLA